MELRNRYPARDVAAALAELDAHFGNRADQALDVYLAYRERIGKPVRSIGAFFARGIDGELRQRIVSLLPAVSPASQPACTDCDGGGWVYDDPADPASARRCLHTRQAAVG